MKSQPSKTRGGFGLLAIAIAPLLTPIEIRLIYYYAIRANNETGSFHPSYKTIQRDTKLRKDSINRANDHLRELGILDWERGYGNQYMRGRSNTYTLNAAVMKTLANKLSAQEGESLTSPSSPVGVPATAVPIPPSEKQQPAATSHVGDAISQIGGADSQIGGADSLRRETNSKCYNSHIRTSSIRTLEISEDESGHRSLDSQAEYERAADRAVSVFSTLIDANSPRWEIADLQEQEQEMLSDQDRQTISEILEMRPVSKAAPAAPATPLQPLTPAIPAMDEVAKAEFRSALAAEIEWLEIDPQRSADELEKLWRDCIDRDLRREARIAFMKFRNARKEAIAA